MMNFSGKIIRAILVGITFCFFAGTTAAESLKASYRKLIADKDFVPARELALTEANNGDPYFMYEASKFLIHGKAGPKDVGSAINWLIKAYDSGDTEVVFRLINIYSDGKHMSQDFVKAFEWAKKGIDTLDKDTFAFEKLALLLAKMYEDGQGTEQNYKAASELYRKVMNIQYFDDQISLSYEAAHKLSRLYEFGLGVPKDNVRAMMWLQLAAQSCREDWCGELRGESREKWDLLSEDGKEAVLSRFEQCFVQSFEGC